MASIVLAQAGTASSSLRCRVTYEASNGTLNITKLEGCRTDANPSGANLANTSVNVKIGNSTSSYNIRNDYIQFPASNAYKTWNGFTGKSVSGLEGNTIVSITFSGGNTTLDNTSFSTTINAGYAATQPTVSASSVAVGSAVTINTPRGSSSYTHTLKYRGAGSGIIATGVATSYVWTLPTSIANDVIDDVKRTITITCETFNGSTSLGTKSVTMTATIPSSYIPTASLSVSRGGITTIAEYVQGKSTIKGTVTGTGSYGSTIKSYSVSANNETINTSTFETKTLTVSGSHIIKATVTDSRTRTSNQVSQTITVQPYSNPSVNNIKFYRCNSSGTADPGGAYVRVSLDYIISSVNNKNARTLSIKIENSTQNVALSAYTGSVLSNVVALATTKPGTATITIGDSYGTQTAYTATVGTIVVPVNIRAEQDGLTLGGFATLPGFRCNWDMYFKSGNQVLDYDVVDTW